MTIALGTEWRHMSGKLAIVLEVGRLSVTVVYDRVDDPAGSWSQYGRQNMDRREFLQTHRLHQLDGTAGAYDQDKSA
jgi:hypothetical protein